MPGTAGSSAVKQKVTVTRHRCITPACLSGSAETISNQMVVSSKKSDHDVHAPGKNLKSCHEVQEAFR